MEIEKIESKLIDDIYYKLKHKSGLEIYLYPKPRGTTNFAMFGTKYGSIDNCFKRSDEKKAEKVPEGIAHFLEHKLFESEDGDAFDRFAKTGASANAYTSFESTCYIFGCTENFYDSLEILLDFVQHPYFTKETVEKEQGIIAQEIKMYDDDPNWRVTFNHLKALYHNHSIKDDIAGTVESIRKITPEYLYRCYNTFYNLNNMVLGLSGNFDIDKTIEVCDRILKPSEDISVTRIFGEEPDRVAKHYIEEKLAVAVPLFEFGFKEKVKSEQRTEKEIATMEVLLELFSSDASPLFRRMLDMGIINESSFYHEYFEGSGYAVVLFGGESNHAEKVAEEIKKEAKRLLADGIPVDDFERAKKAVYGSNISSMNSTTNLASAMVNLAFKDREIFKYLEAFTSVTIDDVTEKLRDVFVEEQSALSVVKPL